MHQAIFYLTLVLTAAAAVIDVCRHRIPNRLTMPALVAGLWLHAAAGGWAGLGESLVAFGIAFGAGLVVYLAGGMGAGDVKLLGAVGALVGRPQVYHALLLTGLIGGLVALAWLVAWSPLSAWVPGLFGAQLAVRGRGADRPERPRKIATRPLSIPYAVPVALGSLLSFLCL